MVEHLRDISRETITKALGRPSALGVKIEMQNPFGINFEKTL
jgi:hypothetical protein